MNPLRKLCSRRAKCKISAITNCFPIIDWLPKYKLSFLRDDLIAGFAVAVMIVPQSLAHGVVAGLPAQYGLYSSFPAMFVYLFLGTSKDISVGATVITALFANQYSVTEMSNPSIIAALTFLSGMVLVFIALCQLSFIIRLLSFPVISGFVSASCLIITVSQLRFLFGLSKPKRQFVYKVQHFFEDLKNTRPGDVTMGLICLILLLLLRHLSKKRLDRNEVVPRWRQLLRKIVRIIAIGRNALIAILAILVSYIFSLYGRGDIFRTVGKVPDGLPKPEFPFKAVKISANETINIGQMVHGFGSGIAVVPLIIIVKSIASSRALGRINRYKVDTFQEILALGIGNMIGSFFKTIPLTACFGRSAVSSSSGSKTPLTGAFTSVIVILVIQFLSPTFSYTPMSSLAAILIAAIINLFDYQLVVKLWKLDKLDLLAWISTFTGCLYKIEVGILMGITVSLCVILFREFNPRLKMNVDVENKTLVVELRGGVWFPGIESVGNRISRKLGKADELIDVVVLDCEDMHEIDYTVIHGLQEIKADCLLNNVELKFENVHGSKMRKMLEGSDLIKNEIINDEEIDDRVLDVLEMDKLTGGEDTEDDEDEELV